MTVSRAQRIVEIAGAEWVGVQKTDEGALAMFRDPVTTSTLALLEEDITVLDVMAAMESSRKEFGVKS